MSNEIEKLLSPPGLEATSFPVNSRYHGVQTKVAAAVSGEPLVHLKRRFVPPESNFSLLQLHTVSEGDRLDNVSHLHLGDAEQFWRICDGNGAIRPDELTDVVGRKLRITLPQGIQGVSDA